MPNLDEHLTRILVAIVAAHRTRGENGRRWPLLHIREGGMQEGIVHPAWSEDRDGFHVGREDLTDLQAYGLLDVVVQRNSWLISPTAEGMEAVDQYHENLSIDASSDDDLDEESSPMPKVSPKPSAADPRRVMVVCGRNQPAVDDLFAYLRAIDLRPSEWSRLVAETGSAAPYIGQVLDIAFTTAAAVVVLSTPDDVAMLRPEYGGSNEPHFETSPTPQARPNVIFEAGLAFGRHPDRTVLLELGDLRPLSDLAGRHAIRLNGKPGPLHELARRLDTAGCKVDLADSPWSYPGRYGHLDPKTLPRVTGDLMTGDEHRDPETQSAPKPTDEKTPPPPEVAAKLAQQGRTVAKAPGVYSVEVD